MDNYGHIRCLVCGACWGAHPPDAPCVRYRPVPVDEGGPVELAPEVARAVEANLRTEIEPSANGKGGR